MSRIRRSIVKPVLLKVHLWTGLGLGLLLVLLGLSGSAIVYPDLLSPPASPSVSSSGPPAPLERQIAAARLANPAFSGQTAIVNLPPPGKATTISFTSAASARRGGRRPQLEIFVDPATARVVGSHMATPSPLVRTAHQLHESLLLGRTGRTLVGWLGVAMTFLGLSGVYLWWPRSGEWKHAFLIRRSIRGAGLYRDIHKAFGIWFLLVFVLVSATGVGIAFPSLTRSSAGQQERQSGPRREVRAGIEIPAGGSRLSLTDIAADAAHAFNATATGMRVPAGTDQAVTVMLETGSGVDRQVLMNPYTGEAAGRRPARGDGLNIRLLHEGRGLGPVYRMLVFITGFLPLLFVTSGFLLWLKRRQPKRRTAPVGSGSGRDVIAG